MGSEMCIRDSCSSQMMLEMGFGLSDRARPTSPSRRLHCQLREAPWGFGACRGQEASPQGETLMNQGLSRPTFQPWWAGRCGRAMVRLGLWGV